ncbi:ABC transporter ATP-binding protein [Actinomadura sp. KC216]|uniref:ABC transporter ATP-binding protein n=1 Tax=Actinomadura sp. KC216 TaxID=2530370 RepID=UPI00104ED81E|nr:ABC transporter ATP-binding protein [Actinomadura sp. KC216]TDB87923.1 ABC transporter ATP-binding protein [Actinomadura sp. KC216]
MTITERFSRRARRGGGGAGGGGAAVGIRLRGVGKRFHDTVVMADLDLDVPAGCFFTLLGPSGCGKSTTLNVIAGLEDATAGEIWIGDTRVFSRSDRLVVPPERRGLGMVFQSYALWPHMTVVQNVGYGPRTRGRSGWRERAMQSLELVRLADHADRYPHQLSGGQQQRVALARALAGEPRALLFDEPLSNLDARLQEELRLELKRLHQELGFTAVYVTHNQEEALVLSDRIAVMRDGGILQEGTPLEVYGSPASIEVARFLGRYNHLEVRLDGAEVELTGLPVRFAAAPAAMDRLVDGRGILCVRPQDVTVEPAGGAPPPDGRPALAGTVETRAYLGTHHDYVIAVGGTRLLARAGVGRSGDLAPGDEVTVTFDAAAALMFPPGAPAVGA